MFPWVQMRRIMTSTYSVFCFSGLCIGSVFLIIFLSSKLYFGYALYKYYLVILTSNIIFLLGTLIAVYSPHLWQQYSHSAITHFPYIACVVAGTVQTVSRCVFVAYTVAVHAVSYTSSHQTSGCQMDVSLKLHIMV